MEIMGLIMIVWCTVFAVIAAGHIIRGENLVMNTIFLLIQFGFAVYWFNRILVLITATA